jgi:RNA polymerase sigma-70 factor (ECF subfamily)
MEPLPGPEPSFTEIIRRHEREIYRLLLIQITDPEVAEDLTQETFLTACRRFSSRDADEAVFGWLCRIALEHFKAYLRSAACRAEIDENSE